MSFGTFISMQVVVSIARRSDQNMKVTGTPKITSLPHGAGGKVVSCVLLKTSILLLFNIRSVASMRRAPTHQLAHGSYLTYFKL